MDAIQKRFMLLILKVVLYHLSINTLLERSTLKVLLVDEAKELISLIKDIKTY